MRMSCDLALENRWYKTPNRRLAECLAVPLDEGSGDKSLGRVAMDSGRIIAKRIAVSLGGRPRDGRSSATRLAASGCACDVAAASYRFIWPRRRLVRRTGSSAQRTAAREFG